MYAYARVCVRVRVRVRVKVCKCESESVCVSVSVRDCTWWYEECAFDPLFPNVHTLHTWRQVPSLCDNRRQCGLFRKPLVHVTFVDGYVHHHWRQNALLSHPKTSQKDIQ